MLKHEVVCIERAGFNYLHSEGVDLAAKITYQSYKPNKDGRGGEHVATLCELFVPMYPPRWDTM